MNGDGIFIFQCSAAAFSLDGLLQFLELLMGIAPRFLAERVEGFIDPLYNVEGINTAGAVRKIFFYALVDPSGPVAGDNLYRRTLLWSKAFQERGENLFPMPVASPDNRVGIVIH